MEKKTCSTLRGIASQNASATWVAEAGRPLHLGGTGQGRRVRLREGRLWLTLTDTNNKGRSDDCWLLHAGQSLHLAPGVGASVEGWPTARFELRELPPCGNLASGGAAA